MKDYFFYSVNTDKSDYSKHFRSQIRTISIILMVVLFNVSLPVVGQSVITVFSENFDNATSTQPWSPYYSSGWFSKEPLNALQAVSGKGKVLHVNFPAGTVGVEHGLGNYRIPLDSAYKELYLSWEYFLPANFDFGWADKLGGGKFFGGFAGGSMTAIPNTDATDVDGWVSILMFQDGYSTTYNYFKGSSFSSGGWPYGERVATIVKGQWRRMTIRLKINDGDLSNGLFEVYDNDVLVHQLANAKIVNGSHPEYLIEHIYLNSFFGGSGREYVSPIDQFMEFDNLIAFYYPKGSTGYRSGPSESGRIIQVPQATSYHPLPPNRFRPTTYTDANGTINSHCSFYQPVNHTDNFETSTIQVSGATSLNINVTKFSYDGGVNYIGYKQILKIYQGIGSNRVLKQTFQNGILTTPGSIAISGNSATIEWQAGQGSQNGFSLNYSSNGTGSGKNFTCADYKARQGIANVSSGNVPSTPSNLSYSNVLDNSATLKWTDNSNNETAFEIERSGPGNANTIVKFQTGSNTTTFSCTGLIGNTTYTFKIRAYNSSGYSAYSNTIQFTTNYALPSAPTNLLSTTQANNSITLKWTDNSNIEEGFKLERSLSPTTGFAEIAVVSSNITSYTDISLNSGTAYYYRIRAYNPAGNSAYTNVLQINTQQLNIPAAPTALKATAIQYNNATVAWSDNANNESGFDLERSGPDNPALTNVISLPANTISYSDNDLISNGTYKYRIKAKNSDGSSVWSNTIELHTLTPVAGTNNPPIIGDQTFTANENAFSNNFVGLIVSIDPDAGQKLTYKLLSGNTGGIFTLNEQTGELKTTSKDIFSPYPQKYILVIQVTDNASDSKSSTAIITVDVLGSSKTVYIDPDNTNDVLKNGSLNHPYSSWTDITWKEGYTYLQKRGTTFKTDKLLVGASSVTLGAYGEGNLPVISSEINTYLVSGFEKSRVKIQNLSLQADNAVSCIYFLGSSTDSITIERCELKGNANAIKVVDGEVLVSRYNWITSENEGIFTTANTNEIYYNIFKDCNTAVNVMSDAAVAKIFNNVFVNNKQSLSISYAELSLYNNIFYLTEADQFALNQGTGRIQSDCNIFFPEQSGFVSVGGKSYNNLDQMQKNLKIDMHSFTSDPQFVDMVNENFGLAENSPAINTGKTLSLRYDFRGNKVPYSGKADIGAFESTLNVNNQISEQKDQSTLTVYPNPSRGLVNIIAEIDQQQASLEPVINILPELRIIDITGKTILSKQLANDFPIRDEIDLSAFTNGMYFVVVQFADKLIKQKFILNK